MDKQKSPISYIIIDEHALNQRIDNFLFKQLKNVPKSRIYRLIRKGEVRINKKRINSDYHLQIGDVVRIPPIVCEASPTHKASTHVQQWLVPFILFENDEVMILNKPAGFPVHGGTQQNIGVIETLRQAKPELKFLELVHRLDRDTSGCLLLAKSRRALTHLHEQMRLNKMKKVYLTLVKGRWPQQLTEITAPLKKSILISGERLVRVDEEGKIARTLFSIVQSFPMATLLQIHLLTGRTHQIRVHTAHATHPIAGDTKYGDKEFNRAIAQLGCKRLFLHAHEITFTLPESAREYHFTAPLPDELKQLLQKL